MKTDTPPLCSTPAPPAAARPQRGRTAGFSVVEILVATAIGLALMMIGYAFVEMTRRTSVAQTELSTAEAAGRAILDLFGADVRMAGYSPLGVQFVAIPQGTTTRVRRLADLDGDGAVGGVSEVDEDYTYRFVSLGAGIFRLDRGVDRNGDGDFVDADESVSVVFDQLVKIDVDRSGTLEEFLTYDVAPPGLTTHVRINFGVRAPRRDPLRRKNLVVEFHADLALRNREDGTL